MAGKGMAKQKLLYLNKILHEQTDPERGLTMPQIIERLAEHGISSERKSLYEDIKVLRDFGMDIRTSQRRPTEYFIGTRDFELTELMLLCDAVASSKFLTERQSTSLIKNIQQLASERQRVQLERRIHVAGRANAGSESVFHAIDVIHTAIRDRRRISFLYMKRDAEGKRVPTRDKPHVMTPVSVAYADDYYYLTCWNDKYEGFTEFRVDRMAQVMITDERAASNEQIAHHMYDEADHVCFGRFGGEDMSCTLHVAADKIEIVTDRFGEKARIARLDETTARADVKIRKSEQFFGWVASMGGLVKIAGPSRLVEEYRAYLTRLLEELPAKSS